jgi:hypothetical protein
MVEDGNLKREKPAFTISMGDQTLNWKNYIEMKMIVFHGHLPLNEHIVAIMDSYVTEWMRETIETYTRHNEKNSKRRLTLEAYLKETYKPYLEQYEHFKQLRQIVASTKTDPCPSQLQSMVKDDLVDVPRLNKSSSVSREHLGMDPDNKVCSVLQPSNQNHYLAQLSLAMTPDDYEKWCEIRQKKLKFLEHRELLTKWLEVIMTSVDAQLDSGSKISKISVELLKMINYLITNRIGAAMILALESRPLKAPDPPSANELVEAISLIKKNTDGIS